MGHASLIEFHGFNLRLRLFALELFLVLFGEITGMRVNAVPIALVKDRHCTEGIVIRVEEYGL